MKEIGAAAWGMADLFIWAIATESLRVFGLGYFWAVLASGCAVAAVGYYLMVVAVPRPASSAMRTR